MLSESPESRNDQIAELAGSFVEFIEAQTGTAPESPRNVQQNNLLPAFKSLDAALDQLADLADIYGSDRMKAIEPLVLPTAALAGEYLRAGASAAWIEPPIDADTTLVIALQSGVAVDLTGAIRASLLSGVSSLSIMIERLLGRETA